MSRARASDLVPSMLRGVVRRVRYFLGIAVVDICMSMVTLLHCAEKIPICFSLDVIFEPLLRFTFTQHYIEEIVLYCHAFICPIMVVRLRPNLQQFTQRLLYKSPCSSCTPLILSFYFRSKPPFPSPSPTSNTALAPLPSNPSPRSPPPHTIPPPPALRANFNFQAGYIHS